MPAITEREPILAKDAEASALRELDEMFKRNRGPHAEALLVGPEGQRFELPASVYQLLRRTIRELARGNGVMVVPVQAMLTTQQAADLLDVSRPFLVKLLESGEIPYHYVGTHRRIRLEALLEYDRRRSQKRRTTLALMIREAQEMGEYE